jgi:hypothetical protein
MPFVRPLPEFKVTAAAIRYVIYLRESNAGETANVLM